jgi:hypothetical protein
MEQTVTSEKLISQFVEEKVISAMGTLLSSSDQDTLLQAALCIASVFGSEPSFPHICTSTGEAEKHLITSFSKNLTLLIQKTWVEESDEAVKEQVLYKLQLFCAALEQKSWAQSYTRFLEVIDGVVYLLFGAQSKSKDFDEYALRIDPEFGIFWWYRQSLPDTTSWTDEKCRIILLLGMFFLANY